MNNGRLVVEVYIYEHYMIAIEFNTRGQMVHLCQIFLANLE